jgi:hypothetical protein
MSAVCSTNVYGFMCKMNERLRMYLTLMLLVFYTGFSPKEGKHILKVHLTDNAWTYQKENDRTREKKIT